MSNLKIYPPNKNLKDVIDAPGGKLMSDLVKKADEQLADHRPQAVRQIVRKIALLESSLPQLGAGGLDFEKLHRVANEIYGEAGTFDLKDISRVAYNLCGVVAAHEEDLSAARKPIIAHVMALGLLAQNDCDTPAHVRTEVFEMLAIKDAA